MQNKGLHARQHARLWIKEPDRGSAVRSGLLNLLALRERERERQADHRRDRHRATSRRELGGTGALGLTVAEHDAMIKRDGGIDKRAVTMAIADAGPVDSDDRDAVTELLAETIERDAAAAAWDFAKQSVTWSDEDWCGDAPSDSGLRKLELVRGRALQAFLVLRAGYGSVPLDNVDAWWLVNARTHLSDAEIGHVLETADALGPGSHTDAAIERMLERCAPVELPRKDQRSEADLARLALERMRTLKRRGWRDVRQAPATSRPQLKR